MRRAGAAVLAAVLALTLAGCGRPDRPQSGKLNVVARCSPYYDFVRQIGGDAVDVSCWCPPGGRTQLRAHAAGRDRRRARRRCSSTTAGKAELWVEDILDAAGEAIPTGWL